MSDIVIKVENLGKKYIIGHQGNGGYKTIREQLVDGVTNFFSHSKKMLVGQQVVEGDEIEEFWALQNINFEIKRGERVGIIGRNGAGKSTLLKILSRITEPTTGKVSIKGRVASLLEVGTGFHPELTGRENIFLNGAILGMSRSEIKKKFDEIVEFSGVEKFLDTPVKRYSSGMYVRLAFAIAAHLEPEILIVDEVLAVGDAEFQEKCIGKMNEVSSQDGRTILFVSHDLTAIEQLCTKTIYLKNKTIAEIGEANEVISRYIRDTKKIGESLDMVLSPGVILEELKLSPDEIQRGSDLKFSIKVKYNQVPAISDLCLLIYSAKNIRIAIVDLRPYLKEIVFNEKHFTYTGVINNLNFIEGEYFFGINYGINGTFRDIHGLSILRVKPDGFNSKVKKHEPKYRGFIELDHHPGS
jgi:lipopolysaccharide transport system ATP-binding protein